MFDDNQEPIDNENEEKEEQDKQESQGPNFEQAKDEIKEKIKKEKKVKDAAQKVQKAQKNIESAKKVKAAAQFASGAKKFALLANPYFWIALLVIIAIILLIGIIMSFTIMPSNFLGKSKRFVEEMMQQFCGFVWGDNTSPISNSSEDVKDLANYIQNMGYDIQGYGFGDVEYTKDTQENQEKAKKDSNGIRENSISGKRNYVTDEQATQGGEIKKIYGLTAVTTVSSSKYDDGDEMYRITGRFSSKNNDYLRAYLSAEAATYTEATYSIKGLFNELGDTIIKGLSDIFGGHSSSDWDDPGDVGAKAKSTGMLNFTNAGGNNIFNSSITGSPTKIKIDAKNKKLILYEHALSIFGLTKIQWGQTFSVDLSNWTAVYGRPLELFLALHLSSMMPDLPYQIAVDQAFNTKVNINLEDVKIYYDTTVTLDGHRVTFGGDFEGNIVFSGDTDKLMIIGDSWIYGTGCSYGIIPGGTISNNYPEAHGEYYYGYSGAGTKDFTESNLETYSNASAIVICLGLNCTGSVSYARECAKDMSRMTSIIQGLNPGKTIYICKTTHVGRGASNPDSWNSNIDEFNRIVESNCDGTSVIFIDPTDVILDSEGYIKSEYATGGGYQRK